MSLMDRRNEAWSGVNRAIEDGHGPNSPEYRAAWADWQEAARAVDQDRSDRIIDELNKAGVPKQNQWDAMIAVRKILEESN